jgi:hypothetical protein
MQGKLLPTIVDCYVRHPVNFKQMGSQSFSFNRRTKNKSQTSVFKVVRDMLTKKWVFIKKEKQLSASSEVAKLLDGDFAVAFLVVVCWL